MSQKILIILHYLVYAMFKKIGTAAFALGCAALPFLSQVTVSGGNVALEANELSSITDSVINGASSLLNMHIQLIPTIVGLTVLLMIIGLVWGLAQLRKRRKRS